MKTKLKPYWKVIGIIFGKPDLLSILIFVGATYACGLKGLIASIIFILLTHIIHFLLINERRVSLIENGELDKDSDLIQWLCRRGVHTWGTVRAYKPPNETTRVLWKKIRHMAFGGRESLCCSEKQVVYCFVSSYLPHPGENCKHCVLKEGWNKLPEELSHYCKPVGE